VLKLARELDAPVAQISAVNDTGSMPSALLNQQNGHAQAKRVELPSSATRPARTTWAAQVSRRTGYQAPLSTPTRARSTMFCCIASGDRLLFLLVVFGVFEVVFSVGQPLSDVFATACPRCRSRPPAAADGWLQSLLLDGVWKGISSVLVFLPQILLLFLFIGILEDSGYLARAALIADRVMRTIGLKWQGLHPAALRLRLRHSRHHGHAPIENKRDRLATILVAPS